MADYLYNMLVQASLLARNAPYIAHARTLAQRTRLAALVLTLFFAARLRSVDSSANELKICWLVRLEPVVRRGGQLLDALREGDPVRSAKRQSIG